MATIPDKAPQVPLLNQSWYQPYVQHMAMLRLDAIHPVISGNKWYKLKHNLQYVLAQGHKGVLTFGGAYSNHLIATAAAAKPFGLSSIGMVRGIQYKDNPTPTLRSCAEHGMQIIPLSREEYDQNGNEDWLHKIATQYPGYFIVPEGGANAQGREGAKDIASFIPAHYTHICVSVGTGTSLIGIRNALPADQPLYGYVPMKNGGYLKDEIDQYLLPDKAPKYQLFDNWNFGGFGKRNDTLIQFMNDFHDQNQIPLDIVYTSKMMYGIQEQLKTGFFPADAQILCIHTGGLQGNNAVQHLLKY